MNEQVDKFKLPLTMLSPIVDPTRLGFSDTSALPPLDEPMGQARALEALDFGLRMQSPGFNLYVSGPIGSGKWSIARERVRRLAQSAPSPVDWCYVNNFQDTSRPCCLSFPASHGRAFVQAMAALVEQLRSDIPKAFESTAYLEAKAKISEETDNKKKALFEELTSIARARGFRFEETPIGFGLVAVRMGKTLPDEELEKLSPADRNDIAEKRRALEGEIREFQVRIHALSHDTERRLGEMDRQVVENVLRDRFDMLRQTYRGQDEVLSYLHQVNEDVVSNYKDFLHRETPPLPIPGLEAASRHPDLPRYQVNLVVEHPAEGGAPVIDESHPTYANLIGKIERKSRLGILYTDFTEIKAGSVLQANGGYLILSAMDLLRQPFAWEALKRVIKTGEVKIEDPGEFFGFTTTSLRPQPVPVQVKVIMVGPPHLYHLLQAFEEDFQKIFKVRADFDVDVPRDQAHDRLYAQFVARLCREEKLQHFDAEAVAELIRYGSRLAERHDRLSLRLSLLSDVIREATFWAGRAGRTLVTAADVETTIAKKRYRANLLEQRVQEEIREGTLIVDLEGEAVGQVNGLSVHLSGDYAFGRPCRITARTFVGTKGVIDIQRESELAGHVHSKGVMTLGGYLAGKFAGAHPFALDATLTFEQTYSEVEGDSASLAELVAILSSLAEIPVRQWLAITGSVNQLGEVQPIGAVNEKIEGFFESCQQHGLTGKQAVIIPARNVKHLALRKEVVDAVAGGTFTVYAVNTVEEAVELLTGVPAGDRGPEGRYPEKTLFGKVATRLAEMAEIVMVRGEDTRGMIRAE